MNPYPCEARMTMLYSIGMSPFLVTSGRQISIISPFNKQKKIISERIWGEIPYKEIRLFRIMSMFRLFRVLAYEILGRLLPVYTILVLL